MASPLAATIANILKSKQQIYLAKIFNNADLPNFNKLGDVSGFSAQNTEKINQSCRYCL